MTTLEMSPHRRDMIHKVMDGQKDLTYVMYLWNQLAWCDQLLFWCIANRYTGKNLCELIRKKFQLMPMATAKWIKQQIDKESAPRPILVGKDFLIN